MNIKKLFNKKTIIISLLFVLSLTLFAVLNISTTYASAESETLEQKIVRFTSSDLLDGEQEGGTDIRSFAQKYKNDEYRAGYTGSYPITSIISKVLPLELFYTEGAHVYMGSEYGFIVYTYTNNSGVSYFSQFLIIDFTFSLAHDKYGTAVTNQPTYRMETLIQQFVEVTRENETSDWNVIQPQSRLGTDIYLKNVYIAANLENENELNFYDSYYDKQKDNGDVILYAGIDYCAHTQVGSVNFEPLLTWGIDFVVTKTAEMNPITDKALSFVEDASSFINAVGEIYNVNDVTYSTIGSESRLQFSNLSKDEQKSNSNYTSYAREVYVKQSDLNNAATAEFVPGMNCDDENSFIELQVITAGLPVNSRISFSVGFEAVFKQVGSANFIKTEDGGYDVLPDDYESATLLAAMFFAARGVPFIYQGQEIGAANSFFESIKDFDDIETINYYHEHRDEYSESELMQKVNYGSRDNPRRPMAWTGERGCGFTEAEKPWLPFATRSKEINVQTDETSEKSVLLFYRKLLRLRNASDVLRRGSYETLHLDTDYYAYCRREKNFEQFNGSNYKNEEYIIICNFEKESHIAGYSEDYECVLTNYAARNGETRAVNGCYAPYECAVFKKA